MRHFRCDGKVVAGRCLTSRWRIAGIRFGRSGHAVVALPALAP
jgi:hypothetical protein